MEHPDCALERLRHNLLTLDQVARDAARLQAAHPTARLGAVLALFYPCRAQPHLVLTRRASHLSSHAGQISLPGGQIDPLDFSPAEAALRETREELGIATDDIVLLGALEPVFTQASNYLLLPFIGTSETAPAFVPSPDEVAEVIELPFAHLLDSASVEDEVWQLRGEHRRVGFYRFHEHKIWGATGRVLRYLVERAGGPTPPPGLVPPGEVRPEVPPAERGL